MKITCTEEEKEQLIITMSFGQCPFSMTAGHKCTRGKCEKCIEAEIEWVIQTEDQKDKPIEMMVTHNDGTVEYLKDIDSVGLIASKDYCITYYGELEGR